ncbi:lipopolysaccharide biosynthesis protein [Tenacibaculum ascidiaceicola]|uniref:lipopolysaccharide biosynthesis protein n=1 Tax=Tenacibaculum ascidiaceicola TaxID=1699411 RepID=UPI003CE5AA4B
MKNFSKDKVLVLLSSIGGKVLGLVASVVVVRLLSTEDFAEWSYYKSFIVFLLPIATLGMEQVFLRYSYVYGTDKNELKKQSFSMAITFSVFVFLFGSIIVFFIRPNEFSNTVLLLFVFLQLFTTPFNLFQQYFHRVKDLFSKYSKVVLLTSIFTSSSLIIGSCINVEIMAFLVSLSYVIYYVVSSVRIKYDYKLLLTIPKERLKYGFNISIGGILNKSIYIFDIFYIANILKDIDALAGYKVISLLPFNLILLANSILIVDFGAFVNFKKKDILEYLLNYWKRGLLLLLPVGVIMFFFNYEIITLLFGERYIEYSPLMFYYFLFISIVILIRSPIGQLLNALGFAGFNSVMTIVQTILLGLLFILPIEFSITQMIFYFCCIILLLSGIQIIKLFRI